ncbi:DNA-3-methyladenine glycosylase [Nakamurella leprariae]|uniref:Putative 3-methyladenine DNA glycosylase n=1 Tax=Nakamurella leprariae TaxID=2803911 RepID=A0A938YGN8_9ACTN|nr:DNA-3-methyladenine glycosylase [Nakamurella leprariae]MBM9467789.1 DNA-3-methyladenine glycosylase [Nakamurella leprariae]
MPRDFLDRPVAEVAADLLGRVLVDTGGYPNVGSPDGLIDSGPVAVRLTEVEAYAGPADPASHAFRGRTARTEVMFGPPGHLYLYFVYGMHWCANIVTGPDGTASAVLLRAAEVLDGTATARVRRPAARTETVLARGPAGLATVLGWSADPAGANGTDLCDPAGRWQLHAGSPVPATGISRGPRVGVAAAAEVRWRFWDTGSPTVSAYRAGTRRRPTTG